MRSTVAWFISYQLSSAPFMEIGDSCVMLLLLPYHRDASASSFPVQKFPPCQNPSFGTSPTFFAKILYEACSSWFLYPVSVHHVVYILLIFFVTHCTFVLPLPASFRLGEPLLMPHLPSSIALRVLLSGSFQ